MSKLFILALDGLEYNLVEKWDLKGLKQVRYGTVDVSEFKHLLTPIIWASFITGAPPEVHGITSWWRVTSNTGLDKVIYWFVYNVPGVRKLGRQRLRNIGKYFGLTVRPPLVMDLQLKGLTTIFDKAEKPVVVDVPSYNEKAETRARYSKAMALGVKNYEREILKIHEERVGRIFEKIDSDWDLFMVWIDLVDQMGHINMGRDNEKMARAYLSLELLAEKVSQRLDPDTTLMIVSDHGMEAVDGVPEHSSHAFYSFDRDVGWTPKSILDYSGFVESFINSEHRV